MKKMLLWSLYLVIVLLLVAGGVNRTAAKLGVDLDYPVFQSRPNNQEVDQGSDENSTVSRDIVAQTGVVIEISQRATTLESNSGETILLERRPWRFALESGLTVNLGDQIQLLGFYDGEYFEIAVITNLATGQSIKLRDENGHPLWSSTE